MQNHNQPDTWDDDTIEFIDLDNPHHHTTQRLSLSHISKLKTTYPLLILVFVICILQSLLLSTDQHITHTIGASSVQLHSSECIIGVDISAPSTATPSTLRAWTISSSNPQTPHATLTAVACLKIIDRSASGLKNP